MNKEYYDDRLILINEYNNLTKKNNKEYLLKFKDENFGQYNVIEQEYNCYYLKKS